MLQEINTINIKESAIDFIETNDKVGLTNLIEESSSKEVVYLVSHLNRKEQIQLFTLLSNEYAAEVMEDIPEAQAVDILEDLEVEHAAAILNEMESDYQADIMNEFMDEDALAILEKMKPDEAASVRKLMSYEDDTAGGMMHTEYFVFYEGRSIKAVIGDLRKNAEKYRYYLLKKIFTIDRKQKLTGVLEMQDLLLSDPMAKLSQIKKKDFVSVNHLEEFTELVDFFDSNDFFGVPVVDNDDTLVGILLRRDVLEEETERVAQQHLESQGIVGGEELRTMPVWLRAKRRLSWLSVNILLNIIAASVIAFHQDVLSSVIALAVFLPIISDMSGCSGNQAVAVSMRELSIGVVTPREVARVLWQEISVGLINGLVLGMLIGLAAFLWKGNVYLGLVVGGALTLNTILAVSLGGTVPLLLKGMNIDPALASGPILTTVTDMVGFLLTLTFASMALVHLGGI
ncbi:MAG: magnesium transporter [Chitinophagales bacterium]